MHILLNLSIPVERRLLLILAFNFMNTFEKLQVIIFGKVFLGPHEMISVFKYALSIKVCGGRMLCCVVFTNRRRVRVQYIVDNNVLSLYVCAGLH